MSEAFDKWDNETGKTYGGFAAKEGRRRAYLAATERAAEIADAHGCEHYDCGAFIAEKIREKE